MNGTNINTPPAETEAGARIAPPLDPDTNEPIVVVHDLATLRELGGCEGRRVFPLESKGNYKGTYRKPKNRGWLDGKLRPTQEFVDWAALGGWVSFVPASLGFWAVDVDRGGWDAVKALIAVLGEPLAIANTRRGWHLFYPLADEHIDNSQWECGPGSGELRGHNGYCVLWDASATLAAMKAAVHAEGVSAAPIRRKRRNGKAPPTANGKAAKANGRTCGTVPAHVGDALAWLTPERIGDAPPYDTWLRVGMGLNDVARGSDEGLCAWDEWSRTFSNYPAADEPTPAEKWGSFGSRDGVTAGTIIELAREHGWKGRVPRRAKGHANGRAHGSTYPVTADGLESALASSEIDLRYNVVGQGPEWKMHGGDWQPTNDLITAAVRAELSRQCCKPNRRGGGEWECSDAKWRLFIDAILYQRQVDPFELWLESLPVWDGTERCAGFFGKCWELQQSNANAALARWGSMYMFLGAVQRTIEPGCKLDEVPVLSGALNLGKSIMGAWMLPPHLRPMFGDSLSLTARGKDRVEATLGKKILEIAELAGSRIADVESAKAYLSRQVDYERLPYRRDPEHIPRRWIAYATTNRHDAIPNDPGGNRRLVPVTVTGRKEKPERILDGYRDQLFAEAIERYRRGERANLPGDLAPILATTSEENRHRESLEDLIEERIGRGDEPGKCDRISSEEAARIIGMLEVPSGEGERSYASLPRSARVELSRSLESLGWRKSRVRCRTSAGKEERGTRWCRTV